MAVIDFRSGSSTYAVSSTNPLPVTAAASEEHVGSVGGHTYLATATITRPADTTAYAAGDLLSTSTTASACRASTITLGRSSSGAAATGMLRRLRLRKSGTSITNASFRVHFFNANPTPTSVVTVTIATPGVMTWTAHGLATGAPIILATTGALPTGLTAATVYYAIKVTADTFQLASSNANAYAGTAINTTGSQSGVHTAYAGLGVGDNGVMSLGTAPGLLGMSSAYVGAIDVTCDRSFADGAAGNGVPLIGGEINFTTQTYYWIIEPRAAYTPISSETFEIACEVLQN